MPKVGSRAFPYSKKGVADAKKAAQKSGKPMTVDKKKMPKGMKGY